jgi:hypothetical protein
MKTAMIVQPMAGRVYEDIVSSRSLAVTALQKKECSIANIAAIDDVGSAEGMKAAGIMNPEMNAFAKFLLNMSRCQVAYFCKGWADDTICLVVHDLAEAFNFEIITE